jgi:hypothetical protein
MPTQNTTIAEGLDDCTAVRISYSATATPNTPVLSDDEGRYLLVERPEPTQALKIVLQYTPATDPYDSFTASYHVTGSFTGWDGNTGSYFTGPYDETFSNGSYGNGPYNRRYTRSIVEDYPDGGHTYDTRMRFLCAPVTVYEYDDDYNPIEYTIEPLGFEISVASDGRTFIGPGPGGVNLFSSSNNTATVTSLTTLDGRAIDIETAAVSDGWAIVVYEVYEWGDSELVRFQFDTDPQATARCNDQRCDNGCIEIVRESDGAWNCICFDPPARPPALGPPRPAPDAPLPIHPKADLHQKRAPLKQVRQKLAKAEADYRETLDDIGEEEEAINNAVAQGDSTAEEIAKSKLEELIDKGSEQANDYQSLKLETEKGSTIEKDLVEAEKTSDTTVIPTIDESVDLGFTQGNRFPVINRGTTVKPTIIGTTINPTVNQGVTIEPTINRFKTSKALRGSGIQLD